MITNEQQYRATKESARIFEEALEHENDQGKYFPPRLRQAMSQGIASELAMLRAQLQEYEDFCAGKIREMTVDRLDDLPDVLIRARISNGWTQRELAEELGIKEQQVRRYEATRYKSAPFIRLAQVAIALGIQINLHATLPDPVEFQARMQEGDEFMARHRESLAAAQSEAAPATRREHVA